MSELGNNVLVDSASANIEQTLAIDENQKEAPALKDQAGGDGPDGPATRTKNETETSPQTRKTSQPNQPAKPPRMTYRRAAELAAQQAASSPTYISFQEENAPVRKYSHNNQQPPQYQQPPTWRKHSYRQPVYQYAPPGQYPQQLQFQVPRKMPNYQRQQSFPGFRDSQPDYVEDRATRNRRIMERYGSSVSVTFQMPRVQFQQLQQRNYRKTSGQMRYDSYDQNEGNSARQSQSSISKAPRKISAPNGPPASVRGHRWSSLSETMENGYDDYDYYEGDYDLEEPFSESDEDEPPAVKEARLKRAARPVLLPTTRRRIRTLSGMIPVVGYSPVWGGPTMCLKCLLFFDLPKQTSDYVDHLLDQHKIVVTDIELIVDLKRYIEHWRRRFAEESIEKIFPLITPLEGDPLFGKADSYYLMLDKVPEDRQTRERLALRRLEEVLSCQQREREDRTFTRQCLFCRYIMNGNSRKLVHHLYTIHRLNLGSPDNLVFVNEYLDTLEAKMRSNVCIKCEKTFTDYHTLYEHMRKKGHRVVNPNNSYYDRFYVINYLELGKKWLEVLAEDFEDNTPAFADSDEEEEEESWNEWQEDVDDTNEMASICLFCDDAFHETEKLLNHMKEKHQYDLKKAFLDGHFSFYDRVKFINYIRKSSLDFVCFICGLDDFRSSTALEKHLEAGDHLATPVEKANWDKEDFLVPTYENDNLLCILSDILELDEDDFGQFTITDHSSDDVGEHKNDNDLEAVEQDEDKEKMETTVTATEQATVECDAGKAAMVVIPEELPDPEESALNDPELRELLQ